MLILPRFVTSILGDEILVDVLFDYVSSWNWSGENNIVFKCKIGSCNSNSITLVTLYLIHTTPPHSLVRHFLPLCIKSWKHLLLSSSVAPIHNSGKSFLMEINSQAGTRIQSSMLRSEKLGHMIVINTYLPTMAHGM